MKSPYFLAVVAASLVAPFVYGSSWQIVPSPNVGTELNQLSGVSAASDTDIWAVGAYIDAQSGHWVPLAEHWDGTAWSVVNTPTLPPGTNLLNAVAVVASNDVWAVGQEFSGQFGTTLIEHWDGTSWSVVPSPNVAGTSNYLFSVAAVASNDIWAVGDTLGNGVFSLALHWNGTAWSIVRTPKQEIVLDGVAAVATNDVWAVGVNERLEAGVAVHWDGTQWTVVSTPTGQDSGLASVVAISSDDVWAGGENNAVATLTLHWNGTAFQNVADPVFQYPLNNGDFLGMTALTSDNVWAAGLILNGSENQALIEHWNGSKWKVSPTPTSAEMSSELDAITSTPDGTLWAVGSAAGEGAQVPSTFILRMNP